MQLLPWNDVLTVSLPFHSESEYNPGALIGRVL